MQFENTQVMGMERAICNMQFLCDDKYTKSDSHYGCYEWGHECDCESCCSGKNNIDNCSDWHRWFLIGENDLKTAQHLIVGSNNSYGFLNNIIVQVDITAPLYWWKWFDTCESGAVVNSYSIMHKILDKEFTPEDFSYEHLVFPQSYATILDTIDTLNYFRDIYINGGRIDMHDGTDTVFEPKDKTIWWQIIQLLPSSYNQRKTVTMNYENLLGMCSKGQRRFHKLNEWSGIDNPDVPNFISWARSLPYAKELIFLYESEGNNNASSCDK